VDSAVFAFASFRLNPAERLLLEDGKPLRLGSRALEILITLVEHAGETVLKDQLIKRVWPDTVVDEGALRVHVAALRKALGDGRDGKRFIGNVPGRGYSFVAPVTREQAQEMVAPAIQATSIGNLPAQLTRVIGRADIITTVVERVAQRRVLTIVGPGGIGKTTVAVAAAEALSGSYTDGVWFVGLASLQDPALVPSAISTSLGNTPGVGDPMSSLVAWLRDKRALIILDSCEHVIGAAAAIAEAMLKAAPQVAVLATSREPLRAEGEWLLRVPPLKVPPETNGLTAAEALGFPAVELFNERATAALDSFLLTDSDLPTAIEICRRLDGVPLAIELAAAQVDVLGVKGLAAQLDDRLAVLTRGRRTALPRQQTLRATIDWSYELLSDSERHLLCRLAVFPGGFTLEAAAAVMCDYCDDPSTVVGEGIASLVAKSLVSRDGSGPTVRWRLLETIRAYALEKLAESDETNLAARRHAEFFRDLIVPTATNPVLRISSDDVARYGREIDNVRAALDWSFSPVGDAAIGIALTAAFAPVWLHLALVVECRERALRALDLLSPDSNLIAPLERRLHIALGIALTLTMGPVERTRVVLTRARELAESVDDVEAELRMLWAQWSMENNSGAYRLAQMTAQRFSEVARRTDDQAFILLGEHFVGTGLLFDGKLREARDCLERVVEQYVPPPSGRHRILFHYDQRVLARARLAHVLCWQGYVNQAKEQARMSFEEAEAADAGFTLCWVLHHAVCPVALMTGDIAAADRGAATINDLATRFDAALWRTLGSCWEGTALVERGEFARGSALLRNALDTCDQTGWRILHAEFLGLLAKGLAGLGQLDTALVTVDEALAGVEHSGDLCNIPLLLRIKGEVLLQQSANKALSAAEGCFLRAIAVAREQEALFTELRAAMSLARLYLKQRRPDEAKKILAPIYDRFTEGFDAPDLLAARDLLEQFI
jgi:predicted ATPase